MRILTSWVAQRLLPDLLVRVGIRQLLAQRLRQEQALLEKGRTAYMGRLIHALDNSPVALHPEKANQQHYELPADYFRLVLGPHLKYSGCLWKGGVHTLAQAEEAALHQCAVRAGLEQGMDILELGCGWGSLTVWMAQNYPKSRIWAMSNSASQREFILSRCHERGLANVDVCTADVNDFRTARRFDRVVSVELFEHVRNYRELFSRIAGWLKPEGQLFVHIFSHRHLAYPFESEGATDWMGRHFFTGGLMPSADLFSYFSEHLNIRHQWWLPGTHYSRTASAWLENLQRNQQEIAEIFFRVYGSDHRLWIGRWRLFFMACQELFGYRKGEEWGISHYLFDRR